MAAGKIQSLLEAANSSPDNDASVNIAKRVWIDDAESSSFFAIARARMFQIDEWNKNSSATVYALFDESGKISSSQPISVGKFIRIGLSGGGKYDWVRVVQITDEPDEVVISVKPSFDPTEQPPKRSAISHFFSLEAENNFCLQKHEKTVSFRVIGLNEKQNNQFTEGLIESARNAAIANFGYYSGLQDKVWKQFCTNILLADEEKD